MKATKGTFVLLTALACVVLAASASLAIAEDDDSEFQGSIELLYRNVTVDGSDNKYDEDFDGLSSGLRLGRFTASWLPSDSKVLDHARFDVEGLGGDPYERNAFRFGRKDAYEVTFENWKQDYIYDLFELVPDEDGAAWDAERRSTNLGVRIFPAERVKLFFRFQESERSGTSLFMKDFQRDLLRLETPLDAEVRRYTVGANFEVGPVDILVSQSLRRYDNQFDNFTENDLGLEQNLTSIDSYEWIQNDSGGSDWTTVKVHSPIGERLNLAVTLYGTFLGDEEIESRVSLNASGRGFGGTCSVSGTPCTSDASCTGGVGDVCVANPFSITDGFSSADLDGETTMIDADLSIAIAAPLDLHLQYRTLERDLDGTLMRDLDGDGVEDDIDGDGTLGTDIQNDYQIDTASAILEYRPMRELGLRFGYRMIDRELDRDGYNGVRDIDYDSDDDDTLVFGLWLKPVDWFRLNADYEDGDITQPFNAVAPAERKHTRVRAHFTPGDDMRVELAYLDFETENFATDIRDPATSWDAVGDGTTWSASFWHRPNDKVDYLLRYAMQEVETAVGIVFDTAGFFGTEAGDSIFDNDNTQILGQVNLTWAPPWRLFARVWLTESDGDNLVLGDVSGLVNRQSIDQEYVHVEIGLRYTFDSGIFVGGSYADFDYDDFNSLLDYDGQILTLSGGLTF